MQNINDTLDQALQNKDMKSIRRALTTWILQDPGFTKGVFDEKLRYCRERGIPEDKIFVPFEGSALNEDPSAWTDRYFASAKTEFDSNFSRERLAHLKKVGRKLFPPASTSSTASSEAVKKKYGDEIPATDNQTARKRSGFPDTSRDRIRREEKKGGLPWWIIAAGIGAAVILWLVFRRK